MFELNFITSNRLKLAHAKHLCRDYAVVIRKQRHYGKGYEEPRIFERESLLAQSIEDALIRWKKNVSKPDEKYFFIEDTSVIVHALSDEHREMPGVDIKYWMQENDFAAVDALLKAKGNNRRVTVRSDVLLTLAKDLANKLGEKYICFTSQANGLIVDRERPFETNPVYPWLDNKTFNKWFVPDGCIEPISMLPIHVADKYDFRAGAFQEMLAFLEHHGVIKRREVARSYALGTQPNLPIVPCLFIVCGPTCAGKTTLAEYMITKYGFYHVEASDFMYLSYFEKLGFNSSISIAEFAKQALAEKPSIVADLILKHIMSIASAPIVITGFRSIKEIIHFMENYTGIFNPEVVTIDAPKEVRLGRYLKRDREGMATPSSFERDSRIQGEMGLKQLMASYINKLIINDSSFEVFYERFNKRYENDLTNLKPFSQREIKTVKPKALQDAILMALYATDGGFYSSAEIAKLIYKTFEIEKSKNNVSRYFNQDIYPFFEVSQVEGVNKFRLSQTGKMHARWYARINR